MGRPAADSIASPALRQHPETDLAYSLHGVAAEWRDAGGAAASLWLPHLDVSVAHEFMRECAAHAAFWRSAAEPGKLVLKTTLDLDHMLRPRVQPGSKIDYQLPAEQVTLTLRADVPLTLKVAGQTLPVGLDLLANGRYFIQIKWSAVLPDQVGSPVALKGEMSCRVKGGMVGEERKFWVGDVGIHKRTFNL